MATSQGQVGAASGCLRDDVLRFAHLGLRDEAEQPLPLDAVEVHRGALGQRARQRRPPVLVESRLPVDDERAKDALPLRVAREPPRPTVAKYP